MALIAYPDKFVEGAYDYVLEPGMVLCVEALVSPRMEIFLSSWKIKCLSQKMGMKI